MKRIGASFCMFDFQAREVHTALATGIHHSFLMTTRNVNGNIDRSTIRHQISNKYIVRRRRVFRLSKIRKIKFVHVDFNGNHH